MDIPVFHKDILLGREDIIVQQVNCIGVMGGGLAKSIYQRYPEVKKEYKKFQKRMLKQFEGDPSELLGFVQYVDTYDGKIIANVFGQVYIREHRGDQTLYTDYTSLTLGIDRVMKYAKESGFSVAIPTYIGCGMANGEWSIVAPAIENIFEDSGVDVKFYHHR